MCRGTKIILVVADKHNQRFYSFLSMDYDTIDIVSPEQSLEFVRSISADVILIDSGIDPEKGLGILTEIKNLAPSVPVIFLTDVRSYDAAIGAYKAGVRDYIKKPVSISELGRIINDLLTLKNKSTEKREPLPCSIFEGGCVDNVRIHPEIPDFISRAISYMENNLSSINDLNDIASQANLSTYHFSRIFKKYTGLSPMEYLRIMKMHKAKELLRTDERSIAHIAEEVGYLDQRSFERQFKLHTGSTPSRFRKSFPK